MFSYRHAFHAGNHADVLKHVITIQLLNYMAQKEAPYLYVDTHAGAGLYALDTGYAAKNAEYENGIGKLWDKKDLPPALQDYLDLIKSINPSVKLRYYPGSPYCAEQVMRLEDRLRLFEMHPSDVKILQENMRKREMHQAEQGQKARGKRVMVMAGDGFESLKALLPPPQRRGIVLIDPPYEDKRDYKRQRHANNRIRALSNRHVCSVVSDFTKNGITRICPKTRTTSRRMAACFPLDFATYARRFWTP